MKVGKAEVVFSLDVESTLTPFEDGHAFGGRLGAFSYIILSHFPAHADAETWSYSLRADDQWVDMVNRFPTKEAAVRALAERLYQDFYKPMTVELCWRLEREGEEPGEWKKSK